MTTIADRWTAFYGDLENLCEELGRDLPDVIAVSKTRTSEEVRQAIDLGITEFGENYPSAFEKRAKEFPEVNWHYIGTLQRNKADQVTPYAKSIHTLDRKKLTRRLRYFDYDNPCFIQVNISKEPSKSGVVYSADMVDDLRTYSINQGLPVKGLMSIGSLDWTEKQTLEEFRKFVDFGKKLGFHQFSLGMSGDWELAVRAGSTHLRIGTAIFGPRD